MFKLRQLIKLASVGQRSLIRNYGNNLLNDRTTFAHRSSNALFSQFDTSKQLTNQCSTFSTVIPQSQQLEERDELAAFAEKNRIKVIGQNAPSPVLDLQQFEWPDSVQRFLNRLQITQPTPIQSAAWPIALSGRDLIGVSATGSGKTLAFLLPAVLRLSSITDSKSPLALVLTPTRELAVQIESVAKQLPSFRTLCCYGGASRDRQKMSLERYNPKLVIATPGRLNDLISDGSVDLSNVEYLVLDEADRMLDMGFEPQIRSIVEKIPKQRQTLMWSATWPESIQQLASDYLDNFVQINVGSNELTANENIEQKVMFCRNEEKRSLLLKTLQDEATQNDGQVPRTLVFVSTKRNADDIQSFLNYKGYASIAVHGDKTQRMRESALDQFRSGKRDILVATDVAARGLDVSNIKLVINFDMANTIEDHVHRIGRTGRANSFGKSISFFTNDDSSLAPKLASLMHQCKQKVDPKLLQIVPSEENKNRFQYRNKGFNMSYRNKSQRPFYNRPRKFSYGSQDSDW